MALNKTAPVNMPPGTQSAAAGQQVRWTLGAMTGRSAPMERLFLQMRYLTNHLRLALIEGERGTGKQLAARTLHELGTCRHAAFVACPAAQFFHNGDVAASRLDAARGGTLYLSDVDQLDHEQQGRLLQLSSHIQGQGAVAPAHGLRQVTLQQSLLPAHAPRMLLVSSTRALRPLVLFGKYRSDLQQHLSGVHLVLPPLRERRDDIALLAELFLARLTATQAAAPKRLSPDALHYLLAQKWTGNVAELRAVVARGAKHAVFAASSWLRCVDVAPTLTRPEPVQPREREPAGYRQYGSLKPAALQSIGGGSRGEAASGPFREVLLLADADADAHAYPGPDPDLDRAIRRHIERVLVSVDGNKLRAARLLGISRSTLYRHLDAAAVSPDRARGMPRGAA